MKLQIVEYRAPNGIIRTLDLKNTNYVKTASGGHFGRNEFTWEKVEVENANRQ